MQRSFHSWFAIGHRLVLQARLFSQNEDCQLSSLPISHDKSLPFFVLGLACYRLLGSQRCSCSKKKPGQPLALAVGIYTFTCYYWATASLLGILKLGDGRSQFSCMRIPKDSHHGCCNVSWATYTTSKRLWPKLRTLGNQHDVNANSRVWCTVANVACQFLSITSQPGSTEAVR